MSKKENIFRPTTDKSERVLVLRDCSDNYYLIPAQKLADALVTEEMVNDLKGFIESGTMGKDFELIGVSEMSISGRRHAYAKPRVSLVADIDVGTS